MDGKDDEALIATMMADPRYPILVARRARLEWTLSAINVMAFMGFLSLVAFDKPLLGTPIGDGVTSLGMPIGIGVLLLAIALTGFYVTQANRHFDAQMAAILSDGRA
jgi:uncharacterized membrane protein (DUF485 family)